MEDEQAKILTYLLSPALKDGMNAMNASERDCAHGQLARSCDRCADAREIAELRAEVERLKAHVAADLTHVSVRPLVWARKDQLQHASTRGGLMCAMYPHTDRRADLQPLYDQAALDAAVAAKVAAERERWRALVGDVRPWLVWSHDSPGTLLDLNALLRRVNEACSLWHGRGPNVGGEPEPTARTNL